MEESDGKIHEVSPVVELPGPSARDTVVEVKTDSEICRVEKKKNTIRRVSGKVGKRKSITVEVHPPHVIVEKPAPVPEKLVESQPIAAPKMPSVEAPASKPPVPALVLGAKEDEKPKMEVYLEQRRDSLIKKLSLEGQTPQVVVTCPRPATSGVLTPVKEVSVEESEIVPDPIPADPISTTSSQRTARGRFIGVAKTMSFLKKTKAVDSSDRVQAQSEFLSRHGMNYNMKVTEEQQFEGSMLKYIWNEWVCDKSTEMHYYWTLVMSFAYLYNLLVIIARIVFIDLSIDYRKFLWLIGDLPMDLIYLIDMWIRNRTGFLEQGIMVRDLNKVRKEYLKSEQFHIDIYTLLPLDHAGTVVASLLGPITEKVYLFPILRFNRLGRYQRIREFVARTETRSSFPNVFRIFCVIAYIVVIIHWNACFYFLMSVCIGLGSDGWVYGEANHQALPPGTADTFTRRYIYCFYWSTLILTTIGEVPWPVHNIEFIFVTIDLMCGVLIFATIVGNVGNMISNMGAAKTDFQNKMDAIKQYMRLRKVTRTLQQRVIKWFDYLWANKQSLMDTEVLKMLPDNLQAEIAMHVHFETLRKVRIFQDCESGLLAELVLKLQLQVFSPNDYVCRRGDIGREMYIVKKGRLKITKDDGTLITYLLEGSVFGELSILNIPGSKNGNRRTANIISMGYTDLFVLSKADLMNALKEYPEAKNMLIKKGREILMKDNLIDESAAEDQRSNEEICELLNQKVKVVQLRIARLTAEYTSTSFKLRERIGYLERQLERYGVIAPDPSIQSLDVPYV
ncbi:hypothetical protein QR680_014921 [Steinernema hermaphroditum]|uniref:Cyclic nucleotide-binding domain-containing protein n=1 Tax=Steinernema hermaphroditum TaxID=289476 RepID=A0AA39M527_9BILA|nr:hypothetical protein QR680_014921 [Steinernema hermaphroditum]